MRIAVLPLTTGVGRFFFAEMADWSTVAGMWFQNDKVRVNGREGVWRVVSEDLRTERVTVVLGATSLTVEQGDLEKVMDGTEPFQVGALAYINLPISHIPVRVVQRGYHDIVVEIDCQELLNVAETELTPREPDESQKLSPLLERARAAFLSALDGDASTSES